MKKIVHYLAEDSATFILHLLLELDANFLLKDTQWLIKQYEILSEKDLITYLPMRINASKYFTDMLLSGYREKCSENYWLLLLLNCISMVNNKFEDPANVLKYCNFANIKEHVNKSAALYNEYIYNVNNLNLENMYSLENSKLMTSIFEYLNVAVNKNEWDGLEELINKLNKEDQSGFVLIPLIIMVATPFDIINYEMPFDVIYHILESPAKDEKIVYSFANGLAKNVSSNILEILENDYEYFRVISLSNANQSKSL